MDEIITEDNRNELSLWENKTQFVKSNFMISAAYKSTLMENKLLALSLMNVKKEGNQLISTMHAAYIKSMLKISKKSGSFYQNLYNTAIAMSKRQMIMQTDKNDFRIMNIITDAVYENGEFTVVWNNSMEPYIYNLSQNFTKLNIATMVTFSSNYAFRLYELLLSRSYHPKGEKNTDNVFHITFELSELKVKLGVVNSNNAEVQKALLKKAGSEVNYKEAENIAKEKSFASWSEFERCCLLVAVKEINENPKSDLHVEYEKLRAGRGAKVVGIAFTVTKNIPDDETIKNTEVVEECLTAIEGLFEEEFLEQDIVKIAEAADYDFAKVSKAYHVMKSSATKIENITGFLLKAIKEGYEMPVSADGKEIKENKKPKNNKFNNAPQRQYDYDELEKKLLAAGLKREDM